MEAMTRKLTEEIYTTDLSVEELWQQLKSDIKSSAEEILGSKPRPGKNDWFDEECKEAINSKNEPYR